MYFYDYGFIIFYSYIYVINTERIYDGNIKGNNLESQKCSIVCSDNANNSIVVQTKTDRSDAYNEAFAENAIANVYYKCNVNISDTVSIQYHTFHDLCGNITNNCKEFGYSQSGQWHSLKTGKIHQLKVDIRLRNNATEIRIKTEICDQIDQFRFNISHTTLTVSLERITFTTIKLPLIKLQSEVVANVMFIVTKSKCAFGWHVEDNSTIGFRCSVRLGDTVVNAGYAEDICSDKYRQTADYCKEQLLYTLDCSYLCLFHDGITLLEGGYVFKRNVTTYPELVGSRRWRKNDISSHIFVLLNECEYNYNLCESGHNLCRDRDDGFSCSAGSYNLTECLLHRTVSYWKCPVDGRSISILKKSSDLVSDRTISRYYMMLIINKYSKPHESLQDLRNMYKILFMLSGTNGSSTFNLTMLNKKYFATFLIRRLNAILGTIFGKDQFKKFNEHSLYYYKEIINEETEKHIIKVFDQLNSTMFVKLELKRSTENQPGNITVEYVQFIGLDIINEASNMTMISARADKVFGFRYNAEEDVMLVKNSDMFSLSLNDKAMFKAIKYKLPPLMKLPENSWAIEFGQACGSLVENRNWTWSTEGCHFNMSDHTCTCEHLSNFALLFAARYVGGYHLHVIDYLSVAGAVINSVSLTLFMVFVLCINSRDKLRMDQLNIAICLLLGTVTFMFASVYRNDNCLVLALAAQFLLLAAFVWKLIFGINVIRLLTSMRYQNNDLLVKYRFVLPAIGYGVPLIIVAMSGILFRKDYDNIGNNVCWIKPKTWASLTFLIPVGLVIAMNTVGLFFIATTLIHNRLLTRKTRVNRSNDLVVFVQLLVSMGFTWVPAMFAIRYLWAMYLFVICFPMQGLLMFLLVVVINKENREKVSIFFSKGLMSLTSKTSVSGDTKMSSKSKLPGQSREVVENERKLLTSLGPDEHEGQSEGNAFVEVKELVTGEYVFQN